MADREREAPEPLGEGGDGGALEFPGASALLKRVSGRISTLLWQQQLMRARQTFMKSAHFASFIDQTSGRFVKPGIAYREDAPAPPPSSEPKKGGTAAMMCCLTSIRLSLAY
jgi:hypothetical protein